MSEEISDLGAPNLPYQPNQQQSQVQQNNNSAAETPMLKVNGDNMQPMRIWIPRITVVILSIMIFLLYFALPPTFELISNQIVFNKSSTPQCNPSQIDTNLKISCSNLTSSNPKVGLIAPNLQPHNQFLIYYLEFVIPEPAVLNFSINQKVEIQVYQVQQVNISANAQELYARNMVYNNSDTFQILNLKAHKGEVVQRNPTVFKYRVAFAYDRIQQPKSPNLDSYLVTMRFTDYSQLTPLQTLTITATTISRKYTIFTIVIRGIYLIFSIISAIVYLRRYCQLKKQDRIMEIKLIASGSILLIMFNDPLYAVTILKINPVSTFLSCFVVVNMLVFLNFVWVFVMRRIFYQPEDKSTELMDLKRSWPFYALFVALNVAIAVLFNQYSYYILQRIPVITSRDLQPMRVVATIVAVAILLAGTIIYQIVMFFRILHKNLTKEASSPPLMGRHIKFVTYYPFFMIIFVIFFAVGGSMPYSMEGAWVLYGYSFVNIYIFILQYLYYTPAEQLQRGGLQQKPSFSNGSLGLKGGQSRIQQGNHEQQVEIQTDLQEQGNRKNNEND